MVCAQHYTYIIIGFISINISQLFLTHTHSAEQIFILPTPLIPTSGTVTFGTQEFTATLSFVEGKVDKLIEQKLDGRKGYKAK